MNNSSPFDSKVPPAIAELERWFSEVIRTPLREVDERGLPVYERNTNTEIKKTISPIPGLSVAQSIGIYNQQYWFRFFTLTQENFPTLVRLFGIHDFNKLIAEPAILKYPPSDWPLFTATRGVVQWIEEEYGEEDKEFILQIARLDFIYHHLFYAPAIHPQPNGPIALKPFVTCLELEGNLLAFRDKLLSEDVAYWMNHEFPEIDFSRNYFFSFHQEKKNLIAQEISESEFIHLKNFEHGNLDDIPIEWMQKWMSQGWIATSFFECLKKEAPSYYRGL